MPGNYVPYSCGDAQGREGFFQYVAAAQDGAFRKWFAHKLNANRHAGFRAHAGGNGQTWQTGKIDWQGVCVHEVGF